MAVVMRIGSETLRENQYRERYARFLEGKRIEGDEQRQKERERQTNG